MRLVGAKPQPLIVGLEELSGKANYGGSANDAANDIAIDASGNAYVKGHTFSSNFPTKNAFQPAFGGDADVFVTKLNANGTDLIYSTYLGGSGGDTGFGGIAIDSSGNAYVTGRTGSTNFPLANPLQPVFGGGPEDAFVAKIDASCTKPCIVRRPKDK